MMFSRRYDALYLLMGIAGNPSCRSQKNAWFDLLCARHLFDGKRVRRTIEFLGQIVPFSDDHEEHTPMMYYEDE